VKYLFYPGCSLEGTAADYDLSARAAFGALDVTFTALDDWNCCGGAAVSSMDPDLSLALSARNLALAEAYGTDVAVACAACYANLRRARSAALASTPAGDRLRASLAEINRQVTGASRVRHLLEIALYDVGLQAITTAVRRPLTGLKVAAYYSCLLGRPKGGFVDPEMPTELDDLIAALGAEPISWSGKTRCCGSSTIMTKELSALHLVDDLLTAAEQGGAQMITTVCPLCHMNLDAYQARVNTVLGRSHNLPIVYFTQLMGVALGVEVTKLGFEKAFVPSRPVLAGVAEGVRR